MENIAKLIESNLFKNCFSGDGWFGFYFLLLRTMFGKISLYCYIKELDYILLFGHALIL